MNIWRAEEAGLTRPLPDDLDHDEIERLLFKKPPEPDKTRPLPVWMNVHRELGRKGVTLWLLWEEYCSVYAGHEVADIQLSRGDGRYIKLLKSLSRIDVLVLDGLAPFSNGVEILCGYGASSD